MRPRISIRGLVRPSVRPLVRWSVRNAFVKFGEKWPFKDSKQQFVDGNEVFRGYVATAHRSHLTAILSFS